MIGMDRSERLITGEVVRGQLHIPICFPQQIHVLSSTLHLTRDLYITFSKISLFTP
jgi:hypothetical protein